MKMAFAYQVFLLRQKERCIFRYNLISIATWGQSDYDTFIVELKAEQFKV